MSDPETHEQQPPPPPPDQGQGGGAAHNPSVQVTKPDSDTNNNEGEPDGLD